VLESSLHFSDVVSTLANINFTVLGVFNAKSKALPFVTVRFPTARSFLKIVAILSDGDADVLVIEQGSIKLKEVYEVFAQVDIFSISFFVRPL
jgi:hypothetical protein